METSFATFHEGELALQRSAGSLERLADVGPRVIRDYMPQQHRDFFGQLPFVLTGAVDAHGQPWASVRVGEPGFMNSPDASRLRVRARTLAHDPSAELFVAGASIGLLGIEPHTRRRNRVNGIVTSADEQGFAIDVTQSFGNCPKYIQARQPRLVASADAVPAARHACVLDDRARDLVGRADTFFIATAHPLAGHSDAPAFGVDVSHRGGKPGFVRVDANDGLTVPDFLGNFFFNTLGNLLLNPRCGLLFVDFDHGDLLYVAATGEVITEGAELRAFQGAQRLLRLRIGSVLHVPEVLPLRWSEAQLSPALAN